MMIFVVCAAFASTSIARRIFSFYLINLFFVCREANFFKMNLQNNAFARISAFFLVFSFLSASFAAAEVMNVSAPLLVPPNSSMTFYENHFSNSNLTGGINGTNITIYIDGNLSNYSTTGASGNASIPAGSPSSRGEHNVTINTSDGNVSKQFTFFVTNVSQGNATFVGSKLPPFSAGETFTVQITALNSTGSPVNGSPIEAKVFADNGGEQTTWTKTNLSATTNANGQMQFNVTIPAGTASGQYALIFERGAIVLIFNIRSGYVIAVNTQSSSEEITSNFFPGQPVMIVGKIRTTAGDPVTGANLSARVTVPNGTAYTVVLSEYNATSSPGQYNNSFDAGATTAPGAYEVRVTATVDSTTIDSFSGFNVKDITAKLSEPKQSDFMFDPFKTGKSFRPGFPVILNALVFNLSDGTTLTGSNTPSAGQVNCSATVLTEVFYASNGTTISVANVTNITGTEFTTTVCAVNFTAPAASGYYGVRANLSLANGTANATAEGFVSVQQYALKTNPVSNIGGGFDFAVMFSPGDNATFQVKAFNLSNGTNINPGSGSDLFIANVTKLTPLEFGEGLTAQVAPTHWIDNGTDTVIITIPNGTIGPYLAEIVAGVGGEEVRGSAFFFSKYVMGFLFPGGDTGGPGGPGPGPSPGGEGPKGSGCNGSTTFNGFINNVKTGQGAQGVTINSIQEARNEITGKDVKGCLSLTPGSTDQNGQASVNITITNNATCTWSGFYFMLINLTYQGNTDLIPSGFDCKNLNFFTQIQSLGTANGSGGWQVSPNSALNVSLQSVTYLNNSGIPAGGKLTFPRIFNFNPGSGGKSLQNNSALNATLAANGTGSILIYPENFSSGGVNLTRWPTGFMDMQPQVCAGAICDTSFGGFQVVSFDAFVDYGFGGGWGQQFGTGQNQSIQIMARTNVINFSIQVGKPWEGSLTSVPYGQINFTKTSDGWNSTNDSMSFNGFERWNVTYTIPSTVPKGFSDVLITVTNNATDTTETHSSVNVVKFSVAAPADEGVQDMQGYPVADPFGNPVNFGINDLYNQTGWNYNYTNGTLGFASKSGFVGARTTLATRNFCSFNAQETNWNGTQPGALRILLLDTVTPGEIDTVLVTNLTSCFAANCSVASKTLKIVNTLSTANRQMWYDGNASKLYFRNAEGCCFARMASSDSSGGCGGNWIGTYQADSKFYIPYVVTKGGVKEAGANVSVRGVIKQDLKAGGSGGFGFQNNLASSTYAAEQATTDANGMAFVGLTVSDSGAFSVFWNMSTATDSDAATFESGSQAEIKRFATFGGKANFTPLGLVTMTQIAGATCGTWTSGGGPAPGAYCYTAQVNETSANDFIDDNQTKPYFVYYTNNTDPSAGQLYLKLGLDDDLDLANGVNDSGLYNLMFSNAYLNETLRPNVNGGSPLNAQFKVANNPSFTGATQQVLLFNQPQGFDQQGVNGSSTGNSTAYVCAETFDRPNPAGVANATVNLTTTVYSYGPGGPTTVGMNMYDPITGTSDVRTGSSGCAIFNFSAPAGFSWPCWGNLQGVISKNLTDTITLSAIANQLLSINASANVTVNTTAIRTNREAFRFGNTRVRALHIATENASGNGVSAVIGDLFYKNPATGFFIQVSGNTSYFPASTSKAVGSHQDGATNHVFLQAANASNFFTISYNRTTDSFVIASAQHGAGVAVGTSGATATDGAGSSIDSINAANATITYLRGSFEEQVYVANVNNQTACGGFGGGGFGGP